MKKTGWKVLGTGPDSRVVEVRANGPDDNLLSYKGAKDEALRSLQEHIEPYIQRIDEIEKARTDARMGRGRSTDDLIRRK